MGQQLVESELLKRQMTQDVVHDLAQPIVVIRGLAEAMRDKTIPVSDDNLDTICQESDRMERLVRGLHVLEQLDAGHLQLNRELIAPKDLVDRLVRMFADQAQRSGISFVTRIDSDLPPVQMDYERMIQAVGNVITNALAYTPVGQSIEIGHG